MEISSGIIDGAQKVVIYGPEGIGKSSFAAKFPGALFEDTEGSTKKLNVRRTPKSTSWTMLLEHVKDIKNNPTLCDTFIIDTGDWAEQLCKAQLCSKASKGGIEDFGYGKGYTYLAEEFGRLLNALSELIDLGVNVVIVAHAQMRKFEQPDEMGAYDRWEMKLEKKVYPLVKEWADMVLFCNYKTYVIDADGQGTAKGTNKVQGGKRVMYTTHHPCWDAKNRHDLQPELPLDYREIAHCIVTRGASTTKSNPVPETKPDDNKVRYWHHPESSCVYTATYADVEGGDGMSCEIDKAEYERLLKKYNQKPVTKPETKQEPPKTTTTMNLSDIPDDPLADVPKALADLMRPNNVTVEEIQQAVASRGYYPQNTPISNYDSEFINGVLVGAWPQVFAMIEQQRVI